MNRYTLFILAMATGLVASSAAVAQWLRVDAGRAEAQERFIDAESVRQSGPMAIYRQVRELVQGPGRDVPGPASIVRRMEYDCMQPRFRVLQSSAYAQPWGKGDAVPWSDVFGAPGGWVPLTQHPAGPAVAAMLCPGGPDG